MLVHTPMNHDTTLVPYSCTVALLFHYIYPGNEASQVENIQTRGKRQGGIEETRRHIH